MDLLPKTLTRPAARIGALAQNALEVARFGGLATGEEASPYEVASEQRVYRLRHYYPGEVADSAPPVLLVPPMMLAAEIYDVSVDTQRGHDPARARCRSLGGRLRRPEHEEGGLERNLADHVLAVSDAVDRVRTATGHDVNLDVYSQGGMFCYQTAAYRRGDRPELADHLRLPGRHPPGGAVCIARRCCRARANAGSSRPTTGSPGPDQRWPTSSTSSSPTTGCSRAAS